MGQDLSQHAPLGRSPVASHRSDWILLILCLAVLGLLLARNLLVLPGSAGRQQPAGLERTDHAPPQRFRVSPPPVDAPVEEPPPQVSDTGPDLSIPLQPAGIAAERPEGTEPASSETLAVRAPIQALPPDDTESATDVAQSAPTPETPPMPPPRPEASPNAADAAMDTASVSDTEMKPGPVAPPAADTRPTVGAATGTPDSGAAAGASQTMYSVQVGSFLDRDLAERLTRRLREKGFDAAILRLRDSRNRLWHVVQIGDWPDRREADRAAADYLRASGTPAVVKTLSSALLSERKVREP